MERGGSAGIIELGETSGWPLKGGHYRVRYGGSTAKNEWLCYGWWLVGAVAVAGFLMFFWGGGDAHAAEFFAVIFAEKDVPLFAAFENFFFLGGDALANFHFDFFFFAEDVGHGLDHVLSNGVAIFDKDDVVTLYQQIDDLVGDPYNFFTTQAHAMVRSLP